MNWTFDMSCTVNLSSIFDSILFYSSKGYEITEKSGEFEQSNKSV